MNLHTVQQEVDDVPANFRRAWPLVPHHASAGDSAAHKLAQYHTVCATVMCQQELVELLEKTEYSRTA
jgi:hypothetical protein